VDPAPPENQAPEIKTFTISSTTVEAKTKVTLVCEASDPDGEGVSYRWEASDGALSTNAGGTVDWTAPATAKTVTITVFVSDGKKTTTQSKTVTVTEPNSPISSFTAKPGNAKIYLNWTNPSSSQFSGVKILRKTDGFSINPTDGALVYQGTEITHTDEGLANGTKYYYTAFSFNTKSEYSTGVTASATPDISAVEPVANPQFSRAGGDFSTSFNLTLSTNTANAVIYFTKDGTIPSKTNGDTYTAPIKINATVTIKAIAVKNGMADSDVISVTYTYNPAATTTSTIATTTTISTTTTSCSTVTTIPGSTSTTTIIGGSTVTTVTESSTTTTTTTIGIQYGIWDTSKWDDGSVFGN